MKHIRLAIEWIASISAVIVMGACSSNAATSLEDFDVELYTPSYATGFRVLGAADQQSTIIEVRNPWQGADNISTRLFIARDNEVVPQGFDGQVINGVAERIVCMSSTQIAMLNAVGSVGSVVGVSGIDYISNGYVLSHRGAIGDVGYEGSVNYELLIALNPDIVLVYGLSGASTMEAKLRELNIPFAYISEYLEESPLGKAEWMVAIAEIVGIRDHGERLFSATPQRYNELKERVSKIESSSKPKIMINTPYSDSWVMAPNGSYVAQLIADAGGEYIYSNNSSSTRSEAIDIEEAYLMVSNADMWINMGTLSSLSELKSKFPKFADTPCVVRGEIYNSNKKINSAGGNDYWESGVVNPDIVLRDLITIFHPELSTDSLVYYHKLK